MYVFRVSQPDPAIDTSRVEEIPAKEPKFHAVPLKSVLKKRGPGSGPGTPQSTPTQENRPLTLRQELHASFKLVPLRVAEFVLLLLEYIHRCWSVQEEKLICLIKNTPTVRELQIFVYIKKENRGKIEKQFEINLLENQQYEKFIILKYLSNWYISNDFHMKYISHWGFEMWYIYF